MKLFESTHVFNHPWEQVTAANWQKYPNEFAAHVVSVDILNRTIDHQKQVLRTERLIGCKQLIPKWLSMLVGGQELSFVREISEVDLVSKSLTMKSQNLTMNHLLLVDETVVYTPDPDLATRTNFRQTAEITAYASFRRVCEKLEEWSVERFGQNAKTGKMAFESVLDTLTKRWQDSGVFVNDMTVTLMHDIQNVSEKTQGVLAEVSKLGNVFAMSDTEKQERILYELEMILRTVKKIDQNIVNCIGLLAEDSGSGDYVELINKNVSTLSEILELLQQASS